MESSCPAPPSQVQFVWEESRRSRSPTEVARTIAQQLSVEAASAPFQYALSTRAGTECVAHALQSLTEENPTTIVMSIDCIGALDLVSRKAMLQALMSIERGSAAMPFQDAAGKLQPTFVSIASNRVKEVNRETR